jgi:DsbC/DsbD-like thiol-disulfide interchange protein
MLALPTSVEDTTCNANPLLELFCMTIRPSSLLPLVAISMIAVAYDGAAAASLSSEWNGGRAETRSRLLAGTVDGKLVAAVEIELADGWKTYWRSPGDAGGVPPTFDWAKSGNAGKVRVLYPAPKRLTDKAGDTLGYKGTVTFPVEIEPADAAKPVSLKLVLEYGVCREVCIPVEAELTLDVPAAGAGAAPTGHAAALEQVPRLASARRAGDPKLLQTTVKLDGDKPTITIEAEFPGGTGKADAFVESPSGFYIPLPKAGIESGKDRLRFVIDLAGAVEPADIKGKPAIVTLVSAQGATEATFTLE